MQEFFELKLGSMTMEEYENKFLELLRYVGFIKEEKVKIQRFLSGLPSFYKDKIQFDEPKLWQRPLERPSTYMSKAKEEKLFRSLGRIRRRRNHIREGRDSNLLSIETVLIHINKINLLRMNPRWKTPWEKGEGYQSNVGDVKKITCTNISLTEKTK
jgi:hypothetical protein